MLGVSGRPIAAISLAGPTYRVTNERVEWLGPEVVQVARDISQLLRSQTVVPTQQAQRPVPHSGHRDQALYGVSPCWDEGRQALLWADRFAPRFHQTTSSTSTHGLTSEAAIDAVGHTSQYAVAFAKGSLLLVNKEGQSHERRFDTLKDLTGLAVRNDGIPFGASYCESGARTMVGPIDRDGRIEEYWSLPAHVEHIVWNASGETLYASAPKRGLIYALSRTKSGPRILARISNASGEPHGMAVDAEDRLWVALYDGWGLARLTPDGEIDHIIALPVPRPTGLAFTSEADGTLHVTTTSMDLVHNVRENAPFSGRVLTVTAPVRGIVPPAMAYAPGDL